jgi:5,10-methenyltetrahydrofolate synthetase
MQTIKQSIRKNLQSLREQLPAAVRTAHSAAITERLLQLPQYRQAGTVLGYMNFGAEFASDLWIQQALADGKKLVLPRVNRHTKQIYIG